MALLFGSLIYLKGSSTSINNHPLPYLLTYGDPNQVWRIRPDPSPGEKGRVRRTARGAYWGGWVSQQLPEVSPFKPRVQSATTATVKVPEKDQGAHNASHLTRSPLRMIDGTEVDLDSDLLLCS